MKFVARTKDQEYLKSKIDNIQSFVEPNNKMEEAITVIDQFMQTNFETEEQRYFFAANIYERLSFFFSILPNDYLNNPMSLNKYFEAMNAAGKGLEQHEILKVQLLKGQNGQEELTRIWNCVSEMDYTIIKRKEDCTEEAYRGLYARAITLCLNGNYKEVFSLCENSYDEEVAMTIGEIAPKERPVSNNKPVEIRNQCIITFPEFLLMVLDIHLSLNGSYSYYRGDLISTFEVNKVENIPAFYSDLLLFRLLLDNYIITKEDTVSGNKYNLIYRNGSSDDIERLCQYQSMLYVSQTAFYNWVKPLLIALKESHNLQANDLLNVLKDIDMKQRVLPESVDDLSYDRQPDRYWFWLLDYYLWDHRDEYFPNPKDQEIVAEYVFRANRSLEHLHPQHQEFNDEWSVNHVHSFGNLAMISQSFNSQQSDDPVTVKFARISDQANNHALQSIKLYRMYLDAKGNPEGWNIERMKNHEQQMFEVFCKYARIHF